MIDWGRVPLLSVIFRGRGVNRLLKNVYEEANRNLERYYVSEQRRFITDAFEIQVLEAAQTYLVINFPEEVISYADAVIDFNATLKDVKDLEAVYISNLAHKTRENAERLHSKKEALEQKMLRMKPIIVSAQKSLLDLLHKE